MTFHDILATYEAKGNMIIIISNLGCCIPGLIVQVPILPHAAYVRPYMSLVVGLNVIL